MNLVTLSSSGEVVQDTRNKLSDKSMVIQFFMIVRRYIGMERCVVQVCINV